MKITTKLLATCAALGLLAIATVAQANTASGIYLYAVGTNGAFGKIDTGSGAYTQIKSNILGAETMPFSLSSNGSGGFYTTEGSKTLYSVDTAGAVSQIGATGSSIRAYGLGLNSVDSKLYGYDQVNDTLGTIDTTTGAYTSIGYTGASATNINNGLTRGRLAFQNGNLYGTFYSSFGKFDLASGLYTGERGGGGYTNMVLASGATNLLGIYNGSILTLDPATGSYNPAAPGASYTTITGADIPTTWAGAAFATSGGSAVPEPATLLGFGVPMLMVGIGKLRGLRK